jgi:class 3 adenylate cyclase
VNTCAACGQENPAIARFCLACGEPFADSIPAAHEERRVVSVIFVDLVGFTARAERLDPEDVRAILTPYHECVRREIESFSGVVEKFIGDAVMGVFGAPIAYGDDAERAVRAALVVRDSVAAMNAADPRLDLQIRVAVNTGEALTSLNARPGLGESMVVGDVVNTASRLQQAAPVNGIVVGEETYLATRASIAYEPAPSVVAKGKAAPLSVWLALRASTPSGERTTSEASLVGRTRELQVLRGIWDSVATERTPHLITILGPAGVGKTRIGQEFARIVEEAGGLTVRGRSLPYRESSAYGAFAAQVKLLCEIYASDSTDVAAAKLRETMKTLLPEAQAIDVADHLGLMIGLDRDSAVADRETLFFSVRCFIEAVARDRPMAFIFEDVHWADRNLLDLVELLAARLHDLPILLLTLARPELLDARPTWGGGLLAYTALPLGPLNEVDAAQLASQRLVAVGGAQAERATDIATVAGGNPLFIEQLAATLVETASGVGETLPTTVRGIVAARLDALPPKERSVLLDAAVVGKVFWRGALERMDSEPDGLADALAALERRDLIRRETVSIIERDHQYMFNHVLIRDVAYDLLSRAARERRHGQTAAFFEDATADVGEASGALARHWRAAGNSERAIEHFVSAAEQAERGWAKDHAVMLYREALELVPEEDAAGRRALRRRLAVASQALFHVPDVRGLP